MSFAKSAFMTEMCNYCQRFELLDMINDAVVLVDAADGNILFMNQRALAMYQYTNEAALALSMTDISTGSHEAAQKRLKIASQYSDGYIFTANNRKKDGSIFKAEISTRYMKMHGRNILASIVRDLSVNSKMREEIELAGKVQRRLLPRDLETDLFRMRSVYQPLNYVSGDLYDIVFAADDQILTGIVIDVMGHGLAAAAQTNILKYLFQRATEKSIPVNDKLAWMNSEVMPFFTGGGFAAIFLFELDFKCKTLTYSSGGINHFLLLNNNEPAINQTPGLFLGINENEAFDQSVLRFQSGDSFFFLTDGLFELIPKPIDAALDFWSMHEMCQKLTRSGNLRDDASGVGILIR